jgi:hypothetical protein
MARHRTTLVSNPAPVLGHGAEPAPILSQKEAAALLRVSVSFLRASSCPKHLLPGNGLRQKPLVRYLRSEVLDWFSARVLTDSPSS